MYVCSWCVTVCYLLLYVDTRRQIGCTGFEYRWFIKLVSCFPFFYYYVTVIHFDMNQVELNNNEIFESPSEKARRALQQKIAKQKVCLYVYFIGEREQYALLIQSRRAILTFFTIILLIFFIVGCLTCALDSFQLVFWD